jgi:bifunctional DNA-binding transcriptional regulator/antitoxin component of YhaV-PrlF toxin-antitoxin module
MYYHVILDANNRISIPYQIRKLAKLKKGDALVMAIVNNEIHLNSINTKIAEAQKLVKQFCGDKNLVEDLLNMRKEEVEKEQHQQQNNVKQEDNKNDK